MPGSFFSSGERGLLFGGLGTLQYMYCLGVATRVPLKRGSIYLCEMICLVITSACTARSYCCALHGRISF